MIKKTETTSSAKEVVNKASSNNLLGKKNSSTKGTKINPDNPTFPEQVYHLLSNDLKRCTDCFETPEEKDILLLSSIATISSILPNVKGRHLKKEVYPMIYTFIIAPPASNKSVMTYSRPLVLPIHQFLKTSGQKLIFGGNMSGAALIKLLDKNNGTGLIFETESDAISKVLTQDFGKDVSTMLRNAFHHEPITVERKDTSIEIEQPKLALAISSTPNQVASLITSVGDGLFSRFSFYAINKSNAEWKDVDDDEIIKEADIDTICREFSTKILNCWKESHTHEISIIRTPEQRQLCDEYFIPMAEELSHHENENMPSVLRRLALTNRRIAMTLTWVRNIERITEMKSDEQLTLTIDNDDMEIALSMTRVLFRHSESIFENMPDEAKKEFTRSKQHQTAIRIYSQLPNDKVLSRKDIISIIRVSNIKTISSSTIDKSLRYLSDSNYFETGLGSGQYKKVTIENK